MAKEYKYKDVVLIAREEGKTCEGCYFRHIEIACITLRDLGFPNCLQKDIIFIEKPKP